MNPNKALWEKGDFTKLAKGMRQSGEALVKALGVQRHMKVCLLYTSDAADE